MNKKEARVRRSRKTRARIAEQRATRLVVSRSNSHIYAQIIDDAAGRTVAAASTLGVSSSGANVAAAAEVGKQIAEAAKQAGVTTVVFDRGGFLFHGRVKALADAAREAGLEF